MKADDLRKSRSASGKPCLHGSRRDPNDLGDLLDLLPFDVHQDQYCAVFLVEERKELSDASGGLGPLGVLGRRRPSVGNRIRQLDARPLAPAPPLIIEDVVRGDPVDPGREGVVGPVLAQVLVNLDEDLAHDVLGVVLRDTHPISQGSDQSLITPYQVRESLGPSGQDLTHGFEVVRIDQRLALLPIVILPLGFRGFTRA